MAAKADAAGVEASPDSSPTPPVTHNTVNNHLIDAPSKWTEFEVATRDAHPDKLLLAFDAEWHGDVLCLVQIALCPSNSKPLHCTAVYTIDCISLDLHDVGRRLQPLLTDVRFRKLAFDCREDCVMFRNKFDFEVRGIFDLQLLERLTRQEESHRSIYNVSGLKKMYQMYPSLAPYLLAKDTQDLTRDGSSSIFMQRPLSEAALQYAAGDVAGLFPLFDLLRLRQLFVERPGPISDEVVRGSIVYSTLNRSIPPAFRRHNMLPLGVLDSLAPANGMKECKGCHRAVTGPNAPYCKICYIIYKRDAS